MLIAPFVLLILGLVFVFLEFYMPGAVMGIIGTVLLLTSIVAFAEASESLGATLLFVIGEIILLFFLIKYTLRYIPKAKPGRSIYLSDDQEGYQASQYDKSAIGKHGFVISDLKPGGYILIEGKKQQAISQSGYIAEGSEVQVIGGEAESLIVREIKSLKEGSTL